MTAFGSTSDCLFANCSIKLPGLVGPDGRGGDQPRGTRVVGNLVREIGISQKQSSAWAQQLTASTWLEGNVLFNSPRAAINYNDAFGGGDVVVGNLLFNHCRKDTTTPLARCAVQCKLSAFIAVRRGDDGGRT